MNKQLPSLPIFPCRERKALWRKVPNREVCSRKTPSEPKAASPLFKWRLQSASPPPLKAHFLLGPQEGKERLQSQVPQDLGWAHLQPGRHSQEVPGGMHGSLWGVRRKVGPRMLLVTHKFPTEKGLLFQSLRDNITGCWEVSRFRGTSQESNLGLPFGLPKVCVLLGGGVLLQGWWWGNQMPNGATFYSQYGSFTCANV